MFSPRLTPSRVPLLDQRWAALPAAIPIHELPPDLPGGPQFGARWNHIGGAAEYSLSFYNGYDHLPLFHEQIESAPFRADVQRFYPQMRMYGADAAIPLSVVTLKAEAGYFTSSTPQSDQYMLYVLQLERQTGEWSFVAGYAGQVVTEHGSAFSFSPVRGFTRAGSDQVPAAARTRRARRSHPRLARVLAGRLGPRPHFLCGDGGEKR